MGTKTRTGSRASRTHARTKPGTLSPIPEPFHAVVTSTVMADHATAKVPTLILANG